MTEQKPASATPEQLHQQRVEAKDGGTVQNVVQVGDNHQGDIILNAIQRVRFDYANRIRNFLTEYLGTSEQPVPFGGREREMTLLNHWLSNATLPPYALLAAPAGRGKSALLVRWLQTLDPNAVRVAFVPVSIRYNTASSNVVFAALAAQLADIYDKSLPQSFHNWLGDQWRDLCLNYLSQPIPKDKKVLVILDGLDEATDWQAGADLFPTVSPSNLRVLVSARFLGGDDDTVGWLTRLGWERQGLVQTIELPTLTAIGVRAVLATMGNPLDALAERDYIVKELFRLSEGDPLLIGLYVKALMPFGTEAAALQPEELPQIKDGLIGYFNRWWKEQRLFWGEGSPLREPGVKSLLNILAIALGPLTREDILAIVPPEVELDSWILIEAIQTMQRFVVGDGKENGYSFSHPKLAQYFYSQLTLNEQIQWENRFLAYGQMQLKTLNGNKLASKSASSYMIQHYGLHLERAKAESKKFYALVSQGWQIAWFALDATYSGFLEDVRRAWERAEQEYNLANIIKCALCQATIVTLSDNIPPQLFALALIHRLLSPRQTLILIAQVSDDNKRSQSIQAVLPYLTSNHFNDVLVIARQIRDERSQAEALIVLVNYLPSVEHEGVLREVLLTISQIQYEPWRAEAIVKITPHLPPTMLHEAVDITRKISLMRSRVIALAELIPYLTYKEQARVLKEALAATEEVDSKKSKVEALTALAARQPPEKKSTMLNDALTIARQIEDKPWRSQVLTNLVPHLPPEKQNAILDEALNTAKNIQNEWSRTQALTEIVPLLDLEQRSVILGIALDSIKQIEFELWQAEALNRLSSYLDPLMLLDALTVAKKLQNEQARVEALTGLIPYLSFENQLLVLNEALADARHIKDEVKQSQILTGLAPFLPKSLIRDALATTNQIDDEWVLVQTLVGIIFYLPELLLVDVLTIISKFEVESSQVLALTKITPYLSPILLDKALEIANQIHDQEWKIQAVSSIAICLPPNKQLEILQNILSTITQIQSYRLRSQILIEIAPHLTQNLLRDAVTYAKQIKDVALQIETLKEVAPYLLPIQQLDVISYLLIIARKVEDLGLRIEALRNLFTCLSPKQQTDVLNDITTTVQQIKEPGLKIETWTWLLTYLPPKQQSDVLSNVLIAIKQIPIARLQVEALLPLINYLSPSQQFKEIHNALIIASQIPEKEWQAQAMCKLALYLPPDRQSEILNDALAIILHIKDEQIRDQTLIAISKILVIWAEVNQKAAYKSWCRAIRELSLNPRPHFLIELRSLIPFTLALKLEEERQNVAVEIFHEIREVAKWWP